MNWYRLFLVILPLFLIVGLHQGCGGGGGDDTPTSPTTSSDTSTSTTTTTTSTDSTTPAAKAAPTCSMRFSMTSLGPHDSTTMTYTITNGPADGAIIPTSCGTFENSNGGSCTWTPPAGIEGFYEFLVAVRNSAGSSKCTSKVYVACDTYTVYNNQSTTSFNGPGSSPCRMVGSGQIITTSLSDGQTVRRYRGTDCVSSNIEGSLTYDNAIHSDGDGNGNCIVNFTSDR